MELQFIRITDVSSSSPHNKKVNEHLKYANRLYAATSKNSFVSNQLLISAFYILHVYSEMEDPLFVERMVLSSINDSK